MKKCSTCRLEKDEESFSWRSRANGTRQAKCKACASQYAKGHYHENKQKYYDKKLRHQEGNAELLKELKSEACTDCGRRYPHYVMDFDHLVAEDKYKPVSRLVSSGRSKMLEEVAKCELVCSNCHRIRTWNRSH